MKPNRNTIFIALCTAFFTLCTLCMNAQSAVSTGDTLRVLCIGNSFTYFHDTPALLSAIAKKEGMPIKTRVANVGGYTFCRHLHDLKTLQAIEAGPYDLVLLQDQSQSFARFAADKRLFRYVLRDAEELVARVRMFSPKAQIWLEATWSYSPGNCGGFGTEQRFDELMTKGAKCLARKTKTQVSPIGVAFAVCKQERPDINLYDPDEKHPSIYGSYLKSCVNFVEIRSRIHAGSAWDASAISPYCPEGCDPAVCLYLRSLAERLKH